MTTWMLFYWLCQKQCCVTRHGAYNPSPWEVEEGGWRVQGQLGLYIVTLTQTKQKWLHTFTFIFQVNPVSFLVSQKGSEKWNFLSMDALNFSPSGHMCHWWHH
jgi:hypothetical protein